MKNLILLFLISFTTNSNACGLAWSNGDPAPNMQLEKTVIIWDETNQTQNFIRSVNFNTKSKNLGFIVPVPSVPTVSEIKDDLFSSLDKKMEEMRPIKYVLFNSNESTKNLGSTGSLTDGIAASAPSSVSIVAEYKLTNFDVKVLKADELSALLDWLKNNGFDNRPALEKWLSNYVKNGSYFTVFNFKSESNQSGMSTNNISIKFKSPAPFYPYRDSEDMVENPERNLILYFLSSTYYTPDFLSKNFKINKPIGWEEKPYFSHDIELDNVFTKMTEKQTMWLTVWKDYTVKRPDQDIFFLKTNQVPEKILLNEVERNILPEVIISGAVLFVIILFLLVVYLLYRIIKKLKD